jgi:lycopene cyclase domain-containing protein
MKGEYLIFNAIIMAGPIVFAFDQRVRYVRYWPKALLATATILPVYIVWDSLVTGKHWWFNPSYTTDVRIAGLPPGEWLFFITVPFACLFIWQILITLYNRGQWQIPFKKIYRVFFLAVPVALLFLFTGKIYTGLVFSAIALAVLLDWMTGSRILAYKHALVYFGILAGLILVFNGYLTARPVVLYGESFQLGIRIITIPVEDFLYGLSHILMCTTVFQALKRGHHGTR